MVDSSSSQLSPNGSTLHVTTAAAIAVTGSTILLARLLAHTRPFIHRRECSLSQDEVEKIWDKVLRPRWQAWRSSGVLHDYPPKNLHPELTKLITVNDYSILWNLPPERFEDLTPTARQVLSGITPTVSTIIGAMLPSRSTLLRSFNVIRPFSTMTEGGRALTKHAHRCQNVKWWGDASGPADVINTKAEMKVSEILDTATWRNVFYLPGNRPVCEFRVEQGYGARWLWSPKDDEIVFRGFLEPPDEEGHAKNWKH